MVLPLTLARFTVFPWPRRLWIAVFLALCVAVRDRDSGLMLFVDLSGPVIERLMGLAEVVAAALIEVVGVCAGGCR
jgi:hypothetical protein